MSYFNLNAIILAAGMGCRMLSDIPKVLYKIGGKCLLQHVIDAVMQLGVKSIYVVYSSNNGRNIMQTIDTRHYTNIPVHWVLQRHLIGTGNAIQQVLPVINDDEDILVLYGDVPFISCKTLRELYGLKSKCDLSMLTAILNNPDGYGRIIRNKEGMVINIVEHADIIDNIHNTIKEINTGIFVAVAKNLKCWLHEVTADNIKNEFYLTDIVHIAHASGCVINTMHPFDLFEILGINSKSDLVVLNRKYQKKQADSLLSSGVMIIDPNRFDLRGTLVHGQDVCIDINVILEGHIVLGNRVQIGSGCILKDVVIGNDVTIFPYSIIEDSKINNFVSIGPFARLRSGNNLLGNNHIGNFVEMKNTLFGKYSKAKHLSYLGDAEIGEYVNIGAGAITCNFDGFKKQRTIVSDHVFIGADSQIIAPVVIGKNATIGAGTTVVKDVADNDTVISRTEQFSIACHHKHSKTKNSV